MTLKLLISDIDGTLVSHRIRSGSLADADALIPASTVQAISRLHSAGIAIAGVTGRTFEQSKDILSLLGVTGPCVFAGGAVIRNLPDGEVLYEASLTQQSVDQVTEILSRYLAAGREIELNASARNTRQYNSIWAKLRKSDAASVREALSKVPDIYFVMNDGHGHLSEFGVAVLAKDVNKGSGVRRLLTILNLASHEVACIGDGDNDEPMFQVCGTTFAMGNATQNLKDAADYVVSDIQERGFDEAVRIALSNG